MPKSRLRLFNNNIVLTKELGCLGPSCFIKVCARQRKPVDSDVSQRHLHRLACGPQKWKKALPIRTKKRARPNFPPGVYSSEAKRRPEQNLPFWHVELRKISKEKDIDNSCFTAASKALKRKDESITYVGPRLIATNHGAGNYISPLVRP